MRLNQKEKAVTTFQAGLKLDPQNNLCIKNLDAAWKIPGPPYKPDANDSSANEEGDYYSDYEDDGEDVDANALSEKGKEKAKSGDMAGALKLFIKASKKEPNVAKYHSNAGAALVRLGKANEAKPYFEQALKLEPENKQTLKNLKKVDELISTASEAAADAGGGGNEQANADQDQSGTGTRHVFKRD